MPMVMVMVMVMVMHLGLELADIRTSVETHLKKNIDEQTWQQACLDREGIDRDTSMNIVINTSVAFYLQFYQVITEFL